MTPAELKHARQSLGLSQENFANALGVRRQTVANWEVGRIAVPALVVWAVKGLLWREVEEYKPILDRLQEVREFEKFQEARRKG